MNDLVRTLQQDGRIRWQQKVLVVELFADLFQQTDGTVNYTYTELDVPEVQDLGPRIESLYVMHITRNRTVLVGAGHAWNVFATWSISGRTWSTPVALMADVTANGEALGSVYSTHTGYGGRVLKFLTGCKNSTAGARENAQTSAWVAITLKS